MSVRQRSNSSGRVQIGVAGAQHRVHDPRPRRVFGGGDAHEAADDARHDRLGDVGDEVAGLAVAKLREHVLGDRADGVLVIRDALGRKAALEERLQAVVLGRVHPDEHRLHELEREDRVAQQRDAADLGGVGLPVAADLVHVLGLRDRPVALLGGVLGDLVGPVHGAAVAQLLEGVVRRAVLPQLAFGHQQVGEGVRVNGHCGSLAEC
jgi:hypothetical protein